MRAVREHDDLLFPCTRKAPEHWMAHFYRRSSHCNTIASKEHNKSYDPKAACSLLPLQYNKIIIQAIKTYVSTLAYIADKDRRANSHFEGVVCIVGVHHLTKHEQQRDTQSRILTLQVCGACTCIPPGTSGSDLKKFASSVRVEL